MDAERQQPHAQPGATKDSDPITIIQSSISKVKEKTTHPTVSVTLVVFLILNVIMLIVGFAKMNDCPVQKKIPIYLIVAGITGIASKLLPFVNRKLDSKIIAYIISILFVFEFIWLILGSVWVYGTDPTFENQHLASFCDKTTYYLAFWLLTLNWIFLGITVVFLCSVCCCAVGALAASKDEDLQ